MSVQELRAKWMESSDRLDAAINAFQQDPLDRGRVAAVQRAWDESAYAYQVYRAARRAQ